MSNLDKLKEPQSPVTVKEIQGMGSSCETFPCNAKITPLGKTRFKVRCSIFKRNVFVFESFQEQWAYVTNQYVTEITGSVLSNILHALNERGFAGE